MAPLRWIARRVRASTVRSRTEPRGTAGLLVIAIAGCAPHAFPEGGQREPPPPASSFPREYRCLESDGPLLRPLPWPEMVEDVSRRHANAHWDQVSAAMKVDDLDERCSLLAAAARDAIAHGLRPFVPIGIRSGNTRWLCPEVVMRYLPYAGDEYRSPANGSPSGGCHGMMPHDAPAAATDPRDGIVWTELYLVGVVWFRLGHYDEALACMGIPREHQFTHAADECIELASRYASAQPEPR